MPFFIVPAPEDLPQEAAGAPQSTMVRVIIDGREAVNFLKHIKELIENPARMLLEI